MKAHLEQRRNPRRERLLNRHFRVEWDGYRQHEARSTAAILGEKQCGCGLVAAEAGEAEAYKG